MQMLKFHAKLRAQEEKLLRDQRLSSRPDWIHLLAAIDDVHVHDENCTSERITTSHIAWGCQRAQDFWKRSLEHWYGREVTKEELEAHKAFFASRKAPSPGITVKNTMIKWYGNWRKEFEDAFIRIWWAMTSIGAALLWQIRNQVVHEGKHWTKHQQLEYMWITLLRQLRAVSRRDRSKPATRVAGLHLHLCLDYFASRPAVKGEDRLLSPRATRKENKESKLQKRIRLYQAAINKG